MTVAELIEVLKLCNADSKISIDADPITTEHNGEVRLLDYELKPRLVTSNGTYITMEFEKRIV